MSDNCPFCGAETEFVDYGSENTPVYSRYSCGYVKDKNVQKIPKDCYERQIAQLQERLEAWRDLPPTVFSEFADHFPEYRKLKDLGEI